ncbi:hypothetical protein P4U99_27250 [Brevibacillus agri]|uniref:hypothetical protein n=1 Tax=Brevibacillus TaxID=55080 RepID=UPI00139724D8|nr:MULTISPECIES: hypothetical protein [Brevibacillus]MED1646811.1 hypothetical protein [Brevibacillus agri]MED1657861.1 hypothetical protein [Brevibacillus agri]MED1690151.1 hypothetical protein [Brevibacillus agri]MED1695328.1 hypothetical protein [Brevibacillus agri]MED1700796.1 hypothetical protein [Brevibacillus agri]
MSMQEISQSIGRPRKKPLLKRWWFWLLSVFAFFLLVGILSSGGESTAYELTKMTEMSKQQIIEKFGKPSEIVREDADGYIFGYDAGFLVRGNEKGVLEISLQKDMIKATTSDTYKIFDVTIGSSYDENVARLGKPDLSTVKDGKKNAMYLTKEDFLLLFSTDFNTEQISSIDFVAYDESLHSQSLDLSKLLGLIASEEGLQKLFEVKDKNTSQGETLYSLEGFELVVDNQSNSVKQIIPTNRIYNIQGIRINDSLDKATQLLGKPLHRNEGVKNTTLYSYSFAGSQRPAIVNLTVNNTDNKIVYMEIKIKQ